MGGLCPQNFRNFSQNSCFFLFKMPQKIDQRANERVILLSMGFFKEGEEEREGREEEGKESGIVGSF